MEIQAAQDKNGRRVPPGDGEEDQLLVADIVWMQGESDAFASRQRDIVFSVECGTPEQAAKSLEHLGSFF
jgi:hypothetical protein